MSYRNYYDSSYIRSRDAGRSTTTSSSTNRPTSVTAKYITPKYKISSIPVLNNDRAPSRDDVSRYNYNNKVDKSYSKYDKKDFNKLTVPSVAASRSRDVSPVLSSASYRSSNHLSPDRRIKNNKDKSPDPNSIERDKDIPNKTDKSSNYNNLSSYKLYARNTSYFRPVSRAEPKSDLSVNRYSLTTRFSSNCLRSPPSVNRTSISPVNHQNQANNEKDKSKSLIIETTTVPEQNNNSYNELVEDCQNDTETVTVVTRHTSPTPPGSSVYVRTRRADMAKTIEKNITRPKKKPDMIDKEIQSDRMDDPTRNSRFGSTSRTSVTNWSVYTPSISSYTGYAGRYSTQYGNMRESPISHNNSESRSSRSRSSEPQPKDMVVFNDNTQQCALQNTVEENPEIITVYEQNKDSDTSEIIINVNLKLKKAKGSSATAATELVSPEITITNSQLPPQAPKVDGTTKVKKIKVRKSSTDSSSDSSPKKKVVKKRSKLTGSSESDQSSDARDKSSSVSPPKSMNKKTSSDNSTSKKSSGKSRENASPDTNLNFSTQSSISEDDSISKSKTHDTSRTSADESIPTDKSLKLSSPLPSQKNEGGTEEAKSFLIRALAPVTGFFKNRNQDSNENSRWLDSSTENTGQDISNLITESEKSKSRSNTDDIVASNDDSLVKLKSIRHIESGERAWWMDSEGSQKGNEYQTSISEPKVPKVIRHIESGERAWWLENNSDKNETQKRSSASCPDSNKPLQRNKYSDDEKPWWLDSNSNVPEGVERLTPPRKSSSESEKSDKFNFFKVRHIESGEKKDWWLTSNENSNSSKLDNQNSLSRSGSDQRNLPLRRIRHIESGERPWWLSSDKNIPEGVEKLTPPPCKALESDSSDNEEVQVYVPPSEIPSFPLQLPDDEPLGDRRSPEGLETPRENEYSQGRSSPYENNHQYLRMNSNNLLYQRDNDKFISRYTDIDDILGTSGQIYSPFMDSILAKRTGHVTFDNDECEEIDPTQVRIHDSTAQRPVIKKMNCSTEVGEYVADNNQLIVPETQLFKIVELDDVTLQVFKDGDYGPYLDLDSTLGEQEEELEGLQDNRKNAIVLRTQLSVRVHAIIEKLHHSQGRELRRALFTLKQTLTADKDLVHEFVANKGLDCLMEVASCADCNYLDYILRALGQILLYVDGMHGVMANKICVQWLYTLINNKLRHVVKTAFKLLLVFVDYTENNCLLLIDAINTVDTSNGKQPWYNVMKILQDIDASDTELLIYATTLINRCLNNVPEKNVYFDQVDALLDQGMADIIQLYMEKQGTDLDLLRQLQIFDSVLLYEDGDESGIALKQLDDSIISAIRRRSISLTTERRKSKKHLQEKVTKNTEPETFSYTSRIQSPTSPIDNKELSSALRRRRDRFARQAHHIQQQELLNNTGICKGLFATNNGNYTNKNGSYTSSNGNNTSSNGNNTISNGNNTPSYGNNISFNRNPTNGDISNKNSNCYNNEEAVYSNLKNTIIEDILTNGNQRYTAGLKQRIQNGTLGHTVTAADALAAMRLKQQEHPEVKDDRGVVINKEHSIKDIAQRLQSPTSPTTEDKPLRVGDMAGIVSKAKEELARSQTKELVKSPTIDILPKVQEVKVSENDLHWEEIRKGCMNREFHLCDLDFSDLRDDSDDETDSPMTITAAIPPPPPINLFPPAGGVPPPPPGSFPASAKINSNTHRSLTSENSSESSIIKKNKKTVKLFWREIKPADVKTKVGESIWDKLPEVPLNTTMLEHLFESRTNDLIIKKLMEPKRNLILDAKRSNAINIAMKKLPPPQAIKAAIMKMDATVIGREGIEKLLSMLPSEEEKVKIQEAQYANPGLPLGSAEQFLLTLASINELTSRLKLWVFKLDFDNIEKEIAEPLMDLKQGIELLTANKTFRIILSTLRSVGSFLNGCQVKGFRLEYLSKVMEVKDTVHKHPLLHHICEMIIQKFPDTTDFFSEVGPVIRASKVDFDILKTNLHKLETDCKSSWDHMKKIAKHDGTQIYKMKINEFLKDAAERIILLNVIKKRVMTRYNKFLLYLGVPPSDINKTLSSDFLKVIAEFALEYRTCRERVLQQLEKKANHRERNKTRGRMITDVGNYSSNNGDQSADKALKDLLKTDPETDSLTENRRKAKPSVKKISVNGDMSADEEIIESLVKAATSKPRSIARERRKNRISDKKNRVTSSASTLHTSTSIPFREQNP